MTEPTALGCQQMDEHKVMVVCAADGSSTPHDTRKPL
jgi:hypothetical protein